MTTEGYKTPWIVFITRLDRVILRSLISYYKWPKKYKYYFSRRLSFFTRKGSIAYCRNHCFLRRIGKATFRFSRMSKYATNILHHEVLFVV